MADYRSDFDEELMQLSREFFEKHVGNCTAGELRALGEIRDARRRLRKLDTFLAGLR